MEEEKLGMIKVFLRGDGKKKEVVVAKLRNTISKKDTLDKVRSLIGQKMKEEHLFVDEENALLDKDLEKESYVEEVLIKDNGSLKIYISTQEIADEENQTEENIQNPQTYNIENSQIDNNIEKGKQNIQNTSEIQKPSDTKKGQINLENNENRELQVRENPEAIQDNKINDSENPKILNNLSQKNGSQNIIINSEDIREKEINGTTRIQSGEEVKINQDNKIPENQNINSKPKESQTVDIGNENLNKIKDKPEEIKNDNENNLHKNIGIGKPGNNVNLNPKKDEELFKDEAIEI